MTVSSSTLLQGQNANQTSASSGGAASTLQITGLHGETVLFNSSEPVLLDNGGNATVAAGTTLSRLHVSITINTPNEKLGISTSGGVGLPDGMTNGGQVRVQGTTIGTLSISEQGTLTFYFNDEATAVRVQELIRALTFSNTAPANGFGSQGVIELRLYDKNGTLAQANVAIIDHITGTNSGDTFSCTSSNLSTGDIIHGADGNDTLLLTGGRTFQISEVGAITSVETLQGSAADDLIRIHGSQLSDVRTIDGGGHENWNVLEILGTSIDLTGKTIIDFAVIRPLDDNATFTFDDKEAAKLLEGISTENDTLILTSGTLSDAERQALHRKGVDTIINNGVTTRYEAPVMMGLNGDRIEASLGHSVFIDAGRDMTISADDALTSLTVSLLNDNDHLGIDTSGTVSLSNGPNNGSKVKVGTVEIGAIQTDFPSTSYLRIAFNGNATADLVQELARALTYTHHGSMGSLTPPYEIRLSLRDGGGREAVAVVVAEVTDTPANAPTGISLSGNKAAEYAVAGTLVGTLSATDPNAGDAFTYTLLDNAGGRFKIEGDKLLVANGFKLDFEQAASHTVKVQVTDRAGNTVAKDFAITVSDVNPEVTAGSADHDVFFGGALNDRLSGGGGHDTIGGGAGKDKLYGGKGKTSKDAFVFDTKLTSKSVANRNKDKIYDF
ncbi:hypothetical protein ACFOYU_06570, partial [Microvirga sp. GCM10011540]